MLLVTDFLLRFVSSRKEVTTLFFQLLRTPGVARKITDAQQLHERRHKKQEDEARLRRRTGSFLAAKKTSKSKLSPQPRLSTDAAWRIRESVVRHYADPFVAISAIAMIVKIPTAAAKKK